MPYVLPPKAQISRQLGPVAYDMLEPGKPYEVIRAYTDFDGIPHPLGERFTFLTHNFLPYDGGHSFFVSFDGEHESHIRMQEDEQAEILGHLGDHFSTV